jgi:tripartite-type tricarboxylate transporter receptor subunit TctC
MQIDLPAAANKYPDGPFRLVIPFPPGGSTGYTAKILAGQLQRLLGQPVTLDVKPGNFGINAIAELVGRSDGYTLMVGSIITNSMTPVWHREDFTFDYDQEIMPITRLADFPSVVMVSPSAFITDVKRGIGKLVLGADFIGTFGDVDAIGLAKAAGIEVAFHCNPNGANGILEDLLSGKSNFAFLNVATASANVGRFKPLAVTGTTRLTNFPAVPTMAEAGFAGIGTINWQGLFASRRISTEVLATLHRAAVEAMNSLQTRAALDTVNAAANTSASSEMFAAAIKAEMNGWQLLLTQVRAIPRA